MAKKAQKKNNKNLIIGICSAVVAVVVIVIVAVVFLSKGGSKKIDDTFFVSDGSKYVLTLGSEYIDTEEDFTPSKSHMVYYYSGEKVTGLEMYYEYADAATAKKAYDILSADADANAEFKEVKLDGKYIVLVANSSDYEGMTTSEVKSQIELMEMLQGIDTDDYDYSVDE